MHGPANGLIAAKREGDVREPARDVAARQGLADAPCRLDEIDSVVIVLLDPGRDGKYVGIKNDVFRRETNFFDQDFVRLGMCLSSWVLPMIVTRCIMLQI